MKLGYITDDNGHETIATTITTARIKALDVNLHVSVNHDVSYPLQSSHNKGFHIVVKDTNNQVITDFNLDDIKTESALIEASTKFFSSEDHFVMITSAASGETLPYDEKVYNQTSINNKTYRSYDDDLEELEDNSERIKDVFLNDEFRWQVK